MPPGTRANLQLQVIVLARCVGDGKCPPPAVTQQHVHVLTRQILKPLAGRQHELQTDHVVGQGALVDDAAGQVAHHDLLLGIDLFDGDAQVGAGVGPAEQRKALGRVQWGQGFGRPVGVADLALENSALTGSAGTVAATVGERQALSQCGIQNAFPGIHIQCVVAGLYVYVMAQTGSARAESKCGPGPA